ncbi:BQ2448_5663 [Microbotryum intermedium]|uniref:BQ2448_5663 protein n=1 Tax=Microbotryum intermedium TaxID=269621 RepID=A0A238F1U6_9BASI|nr:BQ2448_5663 [Microbotryum intermedium]
MASSTPQEATSSTTFALQGRALKFDDLDSIQPYLDQIVSHPPPLTTLILSGNTLGVSASQGLAKALESQKGLKTVDLSDIFTSRLISEIPLALKSLCTSLLSVDGLTELNLSDNAFGGRSAEPMLEFISSHPNLRVLKLNNNGIGPAGGAMIARALFDNAENHKKHHRPSTLTTLICGRNRLENGSSQAFAKAFAALGSLKEVRMPQNGIRMEGIQAIVQGLRENKGLEVLDLQDNTATQRGSKAIARSLPFWPNLRILNLSDCLLRSKGALSMMTVLSTGSNPLLESLKLQSNEMNSVPIFELAKAIRMHLKGLKDLELNGNLGEEGDECYESVREALGVWGNEDALDELDELEEEEEEEEESESEDEVVQAAEKEEAREPKDQVEKGEDDGLANDLANAFAKVHVA